MNTATDTILSKVTADTKDIVISGDTSLGLGDMERIAEKVKIATSLGSLTIKGCGLVDALMVPLIEPLRTHPSVTRLNFSGNNFTDPEFAAKIVAGYSYFDQHERRTKKGNIRINALDLSGNKEVFSGKPYEAFLSAVLKADHIVSIQVPGDPWAQGVSAKIWRRMLTDIDNALNIIALDFGELHDTRAGFLDPKDVSKSDKREKFSAVCTRNKTEATRLIERVMKAETISRDDVVGVHQRLPAILFLIEEKHGREMALRLLKDFDAKTTESLKLTIEISKYLPQEAGAQPTSVPVAAAPAVPAVDPYDPKTILADLEDLDNEDAVTDRIKDGINNPLLLAEIGKNAEVTMGRISVASYHASTTIPTAEALTHAMDGFIAKLNEAADIVEHIADTDIRSGFDNAKKIVDKSKAEASPSFLKSIFGGSEKEKTFADAKNVLQQSVAILQTTSTNVGKIQEATTKHHGLIFGAIGIFERVRDQFQLIDNVGKNFLEAYEAEVAADPDKPTPSDSADAEEYHVAALKTRLGHLSEERQSAQNSINAHVDFAQRVQQQGHSFFMLTQQNFPMLLAEVRTAIAEFDILTQPGHSLAADSSAMAQDLDVDMALQVMRNIYAQTVGLQQTFQKLGQDAHQMKLQIEQAFAPQPLARPTRLAITSDSNPQPIPPIDLPRLKLGLE